MTGKKILYSFIFLLLVSSCSVKRFLPPGEKLYRGSTIKVTKSPEVKTSSASLKKQLKTAVRPKPNKFFLGQPWKVWWYYVIGEPKRDKGFKAFLRKRLGEPPVLSSRVNARSTAENMQAFMENNGYFHSAVSGDTSSSGYFLKANYTANIQPQYTIKSIAWVNDSATIIKELKAFNRRSLLKVGQPYRLSDIQAERDRLDLRLKTRGYYFFSPDYLMAYADSTIGKREVDLFLNVKNTAPESALHPYRINKITVFPNYSLLYPPPDTSKTGTENVDNILIRDTVKKFKSSIFTRAITYRPGKRYSSRSQNTTLNRLINLGVFKFVKNRFDAVKDSGDPYRLNAYYYLTPAKKKSIQAELDGFSKDNRYMGSQLSINLRNRNTFKGAELLTIKAYGSFEISLGDSLRNNNNYRIGGEASLTFPRFVVPFFNIKDTNFYPPTTKMLAGYEYFIKQALYGKNVFRLQYEFNWKQTANKQHNFAPVSLSYLKAANITDSFFKQAAITPSILLNVYDEAILGTYYTYTYNSLRPLAKNQIFFSAGVDLSGNIAGLITGAKNFREKKIFGTPFAQYVKFDAEMRYTRRLKNNLQWANRLQVGIGLPYNNSRLLPFSKQYVIGGPSSIRGFPVRRLGPGSYLPTNEDQRFFQIIGGDYKLLGNTELRIPLAGALGAALFVDAGNIWTKDTLLFGQQGKLSKDFLDEIAVAAGVGLRIDVNILLIRVDLGIPLRKPYLPKGERWVLDKFDFGSRQWRRENMIVNIAIGYPF